MHDMFPDNLIPTKMMRRDTVLYRLIDWYFTYNYRSADRLVVIGRDMQKLMEEKIGDTGSIQFVPNWANDEDVYPLPRSEAPFIS